MKKIIIIFLLFQSYFLYGFENTDLNYLNTLFENANNLYNDGKIYESKEN